MIKTFTECLICRSPLGNESREQGYPTCHKHRSCSVCTKSLTIGELRILVTPALIEEYADHAELLIHPRCFQLSKQSLGTQVVSMRELSIMNTARLPLTINMDCSVKTNQEEAANWAEIMIVNMSFEEAYIYVKRAEAIAARGSILLSKKDKSKIELQLKEIRDERVQASRPPKSTTSDKSTTSKYGINIERWNQLSTNEQTAIKNREKAIEAMMKIPGINRDIAITMFEGAKKQS